MTPRTQTLLMIAATALVCFGLLSGYGQQSQGLTRTRQQERQKLATVMEEVRALQRDTPLLYLEVLKTNLALGKLEDPGLLQQAEQLKGRMALLTTLLPKPLSAQGATLQSQIDALTPLAQSLGVSPILRDTQVYLSWRNTMAESRFEGRVLQLQKGLGQLYDNLRALDRQQQENLQVAQKRLWIGTLAAAATASLLLMVLGSLLPTAPTTPSRFMPPQGASSVENLPPPAFSSEEPVWQEHSPPPLPTVLPEAETTPFPEPYPQPVFPSTFSPEPTASGTAPHLASSTGFVHHEVFSLEDTISADFPAPANETDFFPAPEPAAWEHPAGAADFPVMDSPAVASFTGLSNFDLQNVTPHDPFFVPAPTLSISDPEAGQETSSPESDERETFFTLGFEPDQPQEGTWTANQESPEEAAWEETVSHETPHAEYPPPTPEPADIESLLISSAADALWVVEAGGNGVVFTQGRLQEALGIAPAELRAKPAGWLEKIHTEDRPHIQSLLSAAVAAGQSVDLFYRNTLQPLGWVAHHVTPEKTDGRLKRVLHQLWIKTVMEDPEETPPPPTPEVPPTPPEPPAPTNREIWLVALSPTLAALLGNPLKQEGFSSRPMSPEEAATALPQTMPSAIVADADALGPETCGWLCDHTSRFPALPVLILGALPASASPSPAMQSITKPVSPNSLAQILRQKL